jgi:hypothetical protein
MSVAQRRIGIAPAASGCAARAFTLITITTKTT